ncbi:DNA polymerase III subunit beta [Candidatus Falkowbacteria bacterium]|nr:DNA polymerase III subunit beta [Candidatus Falkowbacteria bacterium]
MKFSSLQENLKQGLFIAGHLTGKNQNLPILNNVLIEAKQGNIKLVSTNLEIGISCVVRGKIDQEGAFTVDAKILADYISLLPNQKIDIGLNNNSLTISCDSYNTKIKGQSAEEFPLIPIVERGNFCKVPVQLLRKALNQVVFAVSTNETRVELTGVLFNLSNKELILAATDSYRLAEKKIGVSESTIESASVIVPAKTIQEVVRIISGTKEDVAGELEDVEVYIYENQIMFVYGSTEIVSRLIEGQYPDYRQIIPGQAKTKATIEQQQIMRAVKASSLFAKTGINDINLDFPKNKGGLIVSSASGQTGENIVEVPGKIEGEDNFVVVNYRYLLDGLNTIGGDEVVVEVVDGNTPCLLRPANNSDYLYIVMPIKQ